MPRPDYLLRWRAEHTVAALWLVARGRKHWLSDRTSYSPPPESRLAATVDRPAFLVVRVPGVSYLGISDHDLRLWRSQYQALLDDPVRTTPYVREQLSMHLAKPRWSAIWYVDRRNRAVSKGWVFDPLAEWSLELAKLLEEVRLEDRLG